MKRLLNGTSGQAEDNTPDKPPGLYYYLWLGDRLRRVKFGRTEPR